MKKISEWFSSVTAGESKVKWMAWAGTLIVITYVLLIGYELAQLSFFFAKGTITAEVYERSTTNINNNFFSIVLMIITSFFKGNSDMKPEEAKEIKFEA